MAAQDFIQRVTVTVEAGTDEQHLMVLTPMVGNDPMTAEIPASHHFRNEAAIAGALRKLAEQIEQGHFFFQGRQK